MSGIRVVWTVISYLAIALPPLSSAQADLSHLSVIALAPLEGRAILKTSDGTLHLVERGNLIPNTQDTLLQVLPDKLIVAEQNGQPTTALEPQIVWIYRAPPDGGKSRILRLQREVPDQRAPHLHQTNVPLQLQP